MEKPHARRHSMSVQSMHDSGLTTEETAAAFARFSRSPDTVRENVAQTLRADTAGFHSKWTLDYGHSSIAEHAPVQLAIENISRVACDLLETGRLASYTEKSSRFQSFDSGQYAAPPEIAGEPTLQALFDDTCTGLMDDSARAEQAILNHLAATDPGGSNHARSARDAARGLLPAAILTSLGYTVNARALAHAVSKLLSHPLQEAQDLGNSIKEAATTHLPTLVRRAEFDHSLSPPPQLRPPTPGTYTPPQLLHYNPGAERIITAAILYSQGYDIDDAEETAQFMPPEGRDEILTSHVALAGKHGRLPREFELASCRIGLTLDYGALRELNRHRQQTNLRRPLSPALGYNIPTLAAAAGLPPLFEAAHQRSSALHAKLLKALGPWAAQYAVLHCHWQRAHISANLRQLHNMLRLRTRENVHPSLRSQIQLTLQLCHHTHPSIFPDQFP